MSVVIIPAPGGSTPVTVPVPQTPNILRNSGFWFAQVQDPPTLTTISVSANARGFGADGWSTIAEAASVQYARVDTNAAPETGLAGRYYGRFVKITNAGKVMIGQAIESVNCQHTRGKQVRLQMLLKASANSTWRLGILQLAAAGTVDAIAPAPASTGWTSAWGASGTDPTITAANNLAYITPDASNTDNTTVVGNALQCSVTTAWQRFGGTFTIPTDCHNLVVVLWSNAQMAVNDEIKMTEAMLALGTDIVVWTPQSYEAELARVRRYIVKSFTVDQLPVANAGDANYLTGFTGKSGTANPALLIPWRFPVPLWTQSGINDVQGFPQRGILKYNPSVAASTAARNFTVAINMGAANSIIAVREKLTYSCIGVGGGGGSGVGDECGIHLLVFAEL